jgi:acetyltransferase-like isoleucine patch superfamily enzyme
MILPILSRIIAAVRNTEPYGTESALRAVLWGFGRRGIAVGRNVTIVGRPRVSIGDNVAIYGNAYLNASGEHGTICIGSRSHVDQFCVLYGQGGLEIGTDCAIASGVIIYTQTNQYYSDPSRLVIQQPVLYKRVVIGDGVWIGAGVVILPGVTIGPNAVIGAGTVVTSDVPEYAVVLGMPGKVIGDRRLGTK